MPPTLALALWFVLLLALFYFDPSKETATSAAVWIPVVWMFIIATRLPSQWFAGQAGQTVQGYEDGNPVDRTIFLVLITLAIGVLMSRSFKIHDFVTRNTSLIVFLSFALLSVVWSDYPFVTFKKWFRDLGNYAVILVVLSDPRPLGAIRTLLRRLSYLLVPLSVLLIKYYPAMGREYSEWSGAATYSGAATTKDELGAICLVSGIFFFWDTLLRWSDRKEGKTKQVILVNIVLFAMTLWLLNMCDSATCRVCLGLGCLVILAARTKAVKRHPAPLKFLVPVVVSLVLFMVFGADMKASLAGAVGRDPTFTDRTLLWSYLLDNMKTNVLVGTGYESFWLGSRLQQLWAQFAFRPNQAHDGYIELYLNLGVLGESLLIGFLIASYRTISRKLGDASEVTTSLGLALWSVTPIYNITTASFGRGELLWLTFLLGAIVIPMPNRDRKSTAAVSDAESGSLAPGRVHLVTRAQQSLEPKRREICVPRGRTVSGSESSFEGSSLDSYRRLRRSWGVPELQVGSSRGQAT